MRIAFAEMQAEFKRVLVNRGFSDEMAAESARLMTETSCDGVYSHGVNRFPRVVEYIDKGYIDVKAVPTKIDGIGGFERWDGNLGMGNINAQKCMDRAIELAREYGIGCVAIKNTNHWLRGGAYGWQAADAGCIGICWTNTQPNMPAWGAKDRRIGNNPLIVAVPRKEGHVVVDMAMAQFSYGKMENCKIKGELLPVPGGYDLEGNLTCDPAAIEKTWRVLPIGYWKGSGLSILLDLTATLLAGGSSSYQVGQLGGDEYQLSQVLIAIDVTKIAGDAFLEQAVNEVLADVKASVRVDEDKEVLYPGERVLKIRAEHLKNGIPVDEGVWNKIKSL
ncbi:3-dehydro-L-gulonate 2-dehydrogenase [Sporomusa sp.]|uniref:3-dehydro-L-gulonate 2-dehydrogenase n=1 Tax=Sporomusa sp. TaxID=2078658 RepID=UPI002C7918BE|nr:3-dehydro-L-gulonate 2-dehydrogenase [Sporomusa sp.]HWR45643.1 3-dehydro-L-gulonate 2-dehydrogenase [Sporomusa sp.]